MSRAFKFGAFVLIHLVIAVIGTAILDSSLRRILVTPSHSFSAIIWTECLLSIVCAMGLGFSLWQLWRNSAAKYTWVPATAWFAFGFVTTLGRNDVFGRLLPFGSGASFGVAEIRSFFAFTVPLIRAMCYSLGAYISSVRTAPAGDFATKRVALISLGIIATVAAVSNGFLAAQGLSSFHTLFRTLVFPDFILSLLLIALGVYAIRKGALRRSPELRKSK